MKYKYSSIIPSVMALAVILSSALWGWADVIRDNKVIAKMVPAHVKVMNSPPLKGSILEVDTERKELSGVPNGYINVFWNKIDSLNTSDFQEKQRKD